MSTPLQNPLDLLLPYQRAWATDSSRFKIGLWARQTGKSFSCACEAVLDCLLSPGSMWVVLSAGERQAIEFMGKAQQWAKALALAIESADLPQDPDTFKRAEIVFGNGSRMVALPANPDTARGYSANVILDEFAFHADSEAIWRAIYPTITNPLRGRKKLRVVSTPNGRQNKFYDLWTKNESYARHRVTIEDAVRDGLPIDLDELRAGIDSEEAWQQEYLCEFTDTAGALLPLDLINACESTAASDAPVDDADPGLPRYVGIDIGTVQDPTVCVTLERRVDGRLYVAEALALKGMDLSAQVALLRPRIHRAARASLDSTGMGKQMGQDFAREFGGKFEAHDFSVAFKREIFPRLRRLFQDGAVRIPVSKTWRDDLNAMRETFTNGQPSYWAPRTADGHSDRCTALALAVHAASNSQPPGRIMPFASRRGRAHEAFRGVGVFA